MTFVIVSPIIVFDAQGQPICRACKAPLLIYPGDDTTIEIQHSEDCPVLEIMADAEAGHRVEARRKLELLTADCGRTQ